MHTCVSLFQPHHPLVFSSFTSGALMLSLLLVVSRGLLSTHTPAMWVFSLSVEFSWGYILFLFIVLGVSGVVFLFSIRYLFGAPNLRTFSRVTLLFIFRMGLLLSAGNILSVFVGWEGLGITSFFLVAFYQNKESLNRRLITIFTNRLGDSALLLALLFLLGTGVLWV